MNTHSAAGSPQTRALEDVVSRPRRFVRSARAGRWDPAPAVLIAAGLLGVLGATGVGYATSRNPSAAPGDLAVVIRVLIIVALVVAGLYAQTRRTQARMGALLVAVGLFSCLWLLNGASNRLLFSVGATCTGAAPVLFAYLLLAYPSGHLRARAERRFLWLTGGVLTVLWLLGIAMTLQPPLRTPLLRCLPHCPSNLFSVGSADHAVTLLRAAIVIAWLAVACGTPLLLFRRVRSASAPMRRALTPVLMIATAAAVLLGASLVLLVAGLEAWTTLGAVYVTLVAVIPLAILAGLASEQLFMGQALAEFVSELARMPAADPEALMAAALRDHTLRIFYRASGSGTYVDGSGAPVADPGGDAAITWIERDGRPIAAVLYDPELADQERFVRAAGAAALIRLEEAQLEAELTASNADLASSRSRMMETAHAERRRLERDLHDGVQQHLVALRIRLDMAAETVRDNPASSEQALARVGREMDDVLQEMRALARGIYPSLLRECGLRDALTAAARGAPISVGVRAPGVGRYAEEVEVAIYFCCLEAIQNAVKHAGPDAAVNVSLSRDGPRLRFEVRDSGRGFDPGQEPSGNGLVNMRDRIDSVGGVLAISTRLARGTSVRGSVPIA